MRKQYGFTLIELLIVVLIMAVLMAIAIPLYLSTVSKSEITVCRSNMQTIVNAEQAYRARDSAHTYTTDLSVLPMDLGAIPVCPGGGTYSVVVSNGSNTANNGSLVPNGGIIVECDAVDHGVFAPSIDGE
jgi:prepilin-type N-terminal cleavage/methylation domain-containing protein